MPVKRVVDVAILLNLVVILLGATVRATGSGAGCGRSWPTCRGELVPALEGATAVEFAHRAFSGLALVAVGWMVIAIFRTTSRGAPVRCGAAVVGAAMVVEALIGMMIVLAEWVADDVSVARVVSVPLHLVSTFVLLGGLVLTRYRLERPEGEGGQDLRSAWPLMAVGAAMVVVAATGAVTALADTLFPKEFDLATAVTAGEHFLTRLRLIHPVVAVVVGVWAAYAAARHLGREDPARLPARIVVVVVALELALGSVNVGLGTPLPVSLLHLLAADVLWMAWVWLILERMADRPGNIGAVLDVSPRA